MPLIAPEVFQTRIRQGMLSVGCRIDEHDFAIECGPRMARVAIGGGRLEEGWTSVETPVRNEDALRTALRTFRRWWEQRRWLDACLAACDFLYGPETGRDPLPYMVETAAIRLFAWTGVDMEQLREAIASTSCIRPHGRRIVDAMGTVWSTFDEVEAPAAFGHRWRVSTRLVPQRIMHALGRHAQFRLTGRSGWGLMGYMEISPGVMWAGGPSPAVWLRDVHPPQAVMDAAKGRPVTDVIGHEAFDVPGLKVLNMRHDGKRTVVTMNAVKEDASAHAAAIRAGRARLAA